jgi:cyclin-dependent kinase
MEGKVHGSFTTSRLAKCNNLLTTTLSFRPLVAGTSESDQLDKIFRLLGTPSVQDYPGIVDLPEYSPDLPPYPPPMGGLASLVSGLDAEGIDLLGKMLQYDPARRITAQQALEHPFFFDMTGRGR